jgi:hypothetical protein
VVKRLIRLYPGRWRRQYGEEMALLLDDLAPLSPGTRLKIAVRAVRLAACAALIGWLPLAALTVMSNVVFPAQLGDDQLAPAGYLYLFAALAVTGAIARRACDRPWSWPLAGAVAGVIIAGLFLATLAATSSPALTARSSESRSKAS